MKSPDTTLQEVSNEMPSIRVSTNIASDDEPWRDMVPAGE
jgi:hypothetical protein